MKIQNDQVKFSIPAEAIAKADEMAARLSSTREEVLNSFFAALLPSFRDGINDHCLEGGWIFPTPKTAKTFLQRERLDKKGFAVCQLSDDSGFVVCDMMD